MTVSLIDQNNNISDILIWSRTLMNVHIFLFFFNLHTWIAIVVSGSQKMKEFNWILSYLGLKNDQALGENSSEL